MDRLCEVENGRKTLPDEIEIERQRVLWYLCVYEDIRSYIEEQVFLKTKMCKMWSVLMFITVLLHTNLPMLHFL